jgi:predicted Zn-dependent peptidase
MLSLAAILLVVVWSLPVNAGYKRANKPNPHDPMDVHIYQLDNGLTVYLTENHEEPNFYAEISVRAGSKDDPAESTGLAHYLEHLLFKGSQRMGTLDWEKEKPHIERIEALYEEHWKEKDSEKRQEIYARINEASQRAADYAIPNEIDRLYQTLGGDRVNAGTGKDLTVYQVELPANRLEQWAMIESERFNNPVFRLFQSELEIVYEEKNTTLDDKDRVLLYPVLEALFKVHPYGQQTNIGTVEHLKNPSLANIHRFYKTYYVPNNMAIAISGAIDIEQTVRTIDRHFSAWKRRDLPEPREWEETPMAHNDTVGVTYPGEEQVTIAFRAPGKVHPDHDAWILADYVMSNRRAGLIDLVNQRQEVREAHAYSSPYLDYSYERFEAVPKKGQTLEEARDILLAQIQALLAGDFDDDLIPSVIAQFKKDYKAKLESNAGRVGKMTNAFASFVDWDDEVSRLERMGRITKADVVRVANDFFGGHYVLGYRRDAQHEVPKIDKPAIDKIDIDPARQSDFAQAVLAAETAPPTPQFVDPEKDYRIVEVHPGVKVYYSENPLNDLFSLRLYFDIGFNQNDKIQFAALLHDRSGTAEFSPEEVKKKWYLLGTDFAFSTRNNESSFSISGLEENFDASLALMQEVIRNPKTDQETLDRLIQITLGRRETSRKDPDFLRLALVLYTRYGETSRLLRRLPSAKVKALQADELMGIVKGLPSYRHSIVYIGSRSLDQVVAALERHHPLKGELTEPPPYRFDRARVVETKEILHLQKEMAASSVAVEMPDGVFEESLVPRIEMFNQYFAGGMSGIVFQEIREARALAYSVGARYYPGGRQNDENLMYASMDTQADKTPEAIEALLGLWDDMPKSEERYHAAHRAQLNHYRTAKLGFRQVLGSVRRWERLGVPVDPRKGRYEGVQGLTLTDVVDFHVKHLAGKPKLISVLGDSTKMDMEKLRSLGAVLSVTADEVATY